MDTLFSLSNFLVLPFWALMIFLPHWRWTKRLSASPLMAMPPALMYAALVVPQLGGLLGALAKPELSAIAAWLASPVLLMVLMVGPLGFLLYLVVRYVLGPAVPPDGLIFVCR